MEVSGIDLGLEGLEPATRPIDLATDEMPQDGRYYHGSKDCGKVSDFPKNSFPSKSEAQIDTGAENMGQVGRGRGMSCVL